MPRTHALDDAPENLHGYFSRKLEPRLRVDSGDTVVYKSRDAGWGYRPPDRPPPMAPLPTRPEGAGHCLSGPVYVQGAEPGDALQVEVLEIVPCPWGFGVHQPGRRAISGILGGEEDDVAVPWFRHYHLEGDRYPIAPGIAVPAAPFMGIYATAPDDDGPIPTAFPGPHGGNMDCKELGASTTLYLPVFVRGALFSVGDGHGTQGDGEVDGAAVETGMDRLSLRLTVRKDMKLERPCAETPTHLLFLAFDQDLDRAALEATRDAMRFLRDRRGLNQDDAYNLASIAVDLRVTQVVDGLKGVHAMVPKAIFTNGAPSLAP